MFLKVCIKFKVNRDKWKVTRYHTSHLALLETSKNGREVDFEQKGRSKNQLKYFAQVKGLWTCKRLSIP